MNDSKNTSSDENLARSGDSNPVPSNTATNDFITESNKPPLPIWKEFIEFLVHQPSWWLVPLILVMLLLAFAVLMVPAEALPFIYTLW